MTTSSVVTGCVRDLSCIRLSLLSTAEFLERGLGIFFASSDFSISWDYTHVDINNPNEEEITRTSVSVQLS